MRDYGKIQGLARGIRKIHTKYSGKLELFTRVNVIFFQKTESFQSDGFRAQHPLLKITQVDVVEVFPQLQNDFNRIIAASYIAELLNRTFEDYDDSHRSVYVLVCNTLRMLAMNQNLRSVLPAFEIKLLAHLGYAPVLDRCTVCQRKRTQTGGYTDGPSQNSSEMLPGFNIAIGGILCPRCKRLKKGTLDITGQAIEVLQGLLETQILHIETITLSPAIHQEVKALLTSYMQYHLGISLRTDMFVQKLRSANLQK